jgi:hypothetical protein
MKTYLYEFYMADFQFSIKLVYVNWAFLLGPHPYEVGMMS